MFGPLTNKKIADDTLDRLDDLASGARDAYLAARSVGSPYWTIAAEVRIGDMFDCQADKIVEMPPPVRLAGQAAGQFERVLESLVEPLRNQARLRWVKAIELAKTVPSAHVWARRARDRLAGRGAPDC